MKITVLGAGSWGLTLSIYLSSKGNDVTIYEAYEDKVKDILKTHENKDALPGIKIPDNIIITPDLKESLNESELILAAVPSKVFNDLFDSISNINNKIPVLNASKGFTTDGKRLSEVILSKGFKDVAVISGPSHAEEVSRGVPAAVTIASTNHKLCEKLQKIVASNKLRVYICNDIVGVEIGGSVKNILAIAAGISDGLGFGDNSKAALVTRGLSEMVKFGVALGGNKETLFGLSGIGDLMVTAFSRHSRNRYFGEQIGKGLKVNEILSSMKMIAEGYYTVSGVYKKSLELSIDMPITNEVYKVLFENKEPKKSVMSLMTRKLKVED